MGGEHAERPRRQDEDARHREEDPHELRGERPLVPMKSRRDEAGEGRGEQRSEDAQRHDEHEQCPEGGAREPSRPRVAVEPELRVDRDEGRAERALAEEVLRDVSDPERGRDRVGRFTGAEVVGDDLLPREADEARREDPDRDERGAAPAARPSVRLLRDRDRRRWSVHFLSQAATLIAPKLEDFKFASPRQSPRLPGEKSGPSNVAMWYLGSPGVSPLSSPAVPCIVGVFSTPRPRRPTTTAPRSKRFRPISCSAGRRRLQARGSGLQHTDGTARPDAAFPYELRIFQRGAFERCRAFRGPWQ